MLTPSISFTYHPDFGTPWWGYYGSYDQPVGSMVTDSLGNQVFVPKLDESGNPMKIHQVYSHYPQGNAPNGAVGAVSFSLGNNLEVKVRDDKDTTGQKPYKIISLIDNLSITGGYNFIADSMNWSNFGVNLRIKLPKVNYTINLSTTLDPYMYQLNAAGVPVRTNKQYWHNGRFPHWSGMSVSFSYTFNNQTFKKLAERLNKNGNARSGASDSTAVRQPSSNKPKDFQATDIQWSLSFNYMLRYGSGSTFDYDRMYYRMEFTQNLSLSGSLNFGSGWKVSATTSFDFVAKTFTYTNFNVTRDLHCWSMSASFVPFGPYKSYNFHIGVNASMLSDLKYDKSSAESTNKTVNWW